MADPTPVTEPDPAPPAVAAGPAAPPGTTLTVPPAPSKARPVVLATPLLQRFVVPGAGDNGGDLEITPAGVALTAKQADLVESLATAYGVSLIDLTPASEKD